jgi:sulfate adenylyltransferase subunit 2
LLADSDFIPKKPTEVVEERLVRCRTIGDVTCTGVWESNATTIEEIIEEVSISRKTERGGRADDKRSDTAMEDRKKDGYF